MTVQFIQEKLLQESGAPNVFRTTLLRTSLSAASSLRRHQRPATLASSQTKSCLTSLLLICPVAWPKKNNGSKYVHFRNLGMRNLRG